VGGQCRRVAQGRLTDVKKRAPGEGLRGGGQSSAGGEDLGTLALSRFSKNSNEVPSD